MPSHKGTDAGTIGRCSLHVDCPDVGLGLSPSHRDVGLEHVDRGVFGEVQQVIGIRSHLLSIAETDA